MDWGSILFDNIGRKIQIVAKVTMFVNIIASFIGGIVMIIMSLINFEYMWFGILLAPFAIVIGCISAWLSVICLYGFGKLIEDVEWIRNTNKTPTKAIAPQVTTVTDKTVTSQNNTYPEKSYKTKKENTAPKANSNDGQIWICGKCDSKNLATNPKCWSCGNPK